MPTDLTASTFLEKLEAYRSPENAKNMQRYFKQSKGDEWMGARMGEVFALAKEFMGMPLAEIEKLLESPLHEARVGAVSIMDWEARKKTTPAGRRKDLFELYLRRHDRINNWDLVDRAAIYVVGGYLFDKPRDILYQLARSENIWERRTAMVSTAYFIREGDLDDAFKIADMLLNDDQDLIHKATGWMLRAAGESDRQRLLDFLDQRAATMPRTALRYAIEKLDKDVRDQYLKLKKEKAK
ncbi:MAG: DNA alkylation repair protein [Anaerolineales bacterium]